MKLNIDKYFDLCCALCGNHRSTDYELGLFDANRGAETFRRQAYIEGWMAVKDPDNEYITLNICPRCAKLYNRISKS